MRKIMLISVIALAVITAQGAIVQVKYAFTGADLINNVFDPTARHSDGSLRVYEGMRQIGPAVGGAVGATFLSGGYLTAFNNTWNAAVDEGRLLSQFWLSGENGYGGQWGEDYKPLEFVAGTGPAGWTFDATEAEWTASEGDGLGLTDPDLASQVFTVTIKFDTEDMWWGNPKNYVWGCNTAPNSIDGLTMYFGSYLSNDEGPVNRYVGNMFAASIPEPATMLLLGLGGLLLRKRRA